MAREMALAGVDRSELTPPPPPEQPHTAQGKWENFWYHYKKVFWVVAAVVAIAAIMLVQTLTKNPVDYEVVVVTELALYPTEIDGLQAYLAAVGTDIDGDGAVEVKVENLVPSYNADGTSSIGLADQQKLINYIAVGEKMLFVFDRPSYEGFTKAIDEITDDQYVFFAPLDVTSAGYDDDGHYWCWQDDTRRTEYALDALPAELLFGVRSPEGTAGNKHAVAVYEQGAVLLTALAN